MNLTRLSYLAICFFSIISISGCLQDLNEIPNGSEKTDHETEENVQNDTSTNSGNNESTNESTKESDQVNPGSENTNSVETVTALLDRSSWVLTSSNNQEELWRAVDGDPNSRWSTKAPQEPDQYIQINFPGTVNVNQIEMQTKHMGESNGDHPINLKVEISQKNNEWSTYKVIKGSETGNSLIRMSDVDTTSIRLVQTGSSDKNWWSIHELNIIVNQIVERNTSAKPDGNTGNSNPSNNQDIPASENEDMPISDNIGIDLAVAKQQYEAQCASCHGDNGSKRPFPLSGVYPDRDALIEVIDSTMPKFNSTACEGDCAINTAAYIASVLFPDNNQDENETLSENNNAETTGDQTNSNSDLANQMFPNTRFSAVNRRAYRLTKPQIVNTINMVLDVNLPSSALGLDPNEGSFSTGSDYLVVSSEFLNDIMSSIESSYNINNEDQLRRFMQCESSAPLHCTASNCSPCVDNFITDLSLKAYRRPISTEKRSQLRTLYNNLDTKLDKIDTVNYFIQTVLTSPNFLFKFEQGNFENNLYKLTPHEILAYTSLTLTDYPPEASDINNASNIVNNNSKFSQYVHKLIGSDKGKEMLSNFLKDWVDLNAIEFPNKDRSKFQKFTPEVQQAMITEVDKFVEHTVNQNKLTLDTFLTSNISYLEPALADFYGESSNGWVEVSDSRKGILTKGAYTAYNAGSVNTNPTKRGSKIVEELLCQDLPGFPEVANVFGQTIALDDSLTTRQKFEAHTINPNCASCHEILDPLGFGLENYAADGSFREFENGITVDSSDEFTTLPFSTFQFNGAEEMIDQIAKAPETKACFVRQAFRYTAGRLETENDNKILHDAMKAYEESEFDMRSVFKSLLTSPDIFLRR